MRISLLGCKWAALFVFCCVASLLGMEAVTCETDFCTTGFCFKNLSKK